MKQTFPTLSHFIDEELTLENKSIIQYDSQRKKIQIQINRNESNNIPTFCKKIQLPYNQYGFSIVIQNQFNSFERMF